MNIMKDLLKNKYLLSLGLLALLSLPCLGGNAKYSVTGSGAPKDGAKVYLVDRTSRAAIDSTTVSGGNFSMKGKAPKDAFLSVVVEGTGRGFPFFCDGKGVTVNVKDGSLSGSKLNTKLSECLRTNDEAYAQYQGFIRAFESLPEEQQALRAKDFEEQYRKEIKTYADIVQIMILENKDNLIPLAFIEYYPSLLSAANNWDKAKGLRKMDELLSSNPDLASHPYVIDFKRRMAQDDAQRALQAKRSTSFIGQKFRELEEADVNGAMHKLSEYAGRGKWVLVDFWASWCGPCKAEMPNVTAAYKKYHSKGFEIVGVSFDRDKDRWVKAIKDWDMPWIHLSDLKYWNNAAREVYGVDAIPDNILIDPEGNIVARGLRGQDLEKRLAQIYK